MTQRKFIGAAIAAALSTTTLLACSQGGNSANQNASGEQSGITLDRKAEKALREAIAEAPMHGLKPELFLTDGEAKGDALVEAGLKYASALANGYSDPKELFEVYTIPRAQTDVRAGLRQAIEEGRVSEWLKSLPPQTDEYRALSQAFLRYAKQAGETADRPIPADTPIKPGARDERIPAIVAVLRSGGYLPEEQQSNDQGQQQQPTTYTPQLVEAVKQFQADSGVKSDGVLGKDTIGALSTGPAARARQLAVAMERLRWLQRDPPGTRIDVNTAATVLDYWRDGQHADRRKVVAGDAPTPTPQLQSPLYRLVAKPTWTVPQGIAEKELVPKGQDWLNRNNFVVKDGQYVQQSGPKNSLGLVKLDLKNDQAIYLHDTPAKALFAQDERHRSHGCVRVENAVQFATMLAEQEGVRDKFEQAMAKDDQAFIQLPREIPVRLLYQTAFWDGARIQFRDDVYGWDENIAKALQLAAGPPRKIRQPQSSDDIGP
ncbi:MAG TPA: L,D-transpeptidase family protein [Sphingomicrobium sp.]|nr:L,D-transpeptidase family protein [Sphingomicrobium sp.]